MSEATQPGKLARFVRVALHLVFWPFNVLLTAIVVLGYLPIVLVTQITDAVEGLARWDFVFGSCVLVAVPPLTLIYAFKHRHHYAAPAELAVLFFGVELPLVAVTAARLFGFQQLSGAAQLVYFCLVAGGVVAEMRLLAGDRLPRFQLLDDIAHGLLVARSLAGLYVGFLLSSLSVPALVTMGIEALDSTVNALDRTPELIIWSPLFLIAGVFFLVILTLPLTAPLSWLYALQKSARELKAKWGADDLFFSSFAPVVICLVGFKLMVPQPHVEALALLKETPKNDDERRAIVAQQELISHGLLDAYLGKHSYFEDDSNTAWGEIASLGNRIGSHEEHHELNAQMNTLARPFTYEGRNNDATRASELYRDFFGREIERDHAVAVRDALAATWSRQERYAGFINEGEQRVRLTRQHVNASPVPGTPSAFNVEIHDVWVNQTPRDEEVALFFELPESAAVTSLWLSPTSRKEDGFAHIVAPRGAAQQVYNEEVRAKRDPALLEQVGPRQYRLRVFPIPAATTRNSGVYDTWAEEGAPRVHVWVGYQTLLVEGKVPLPQLRERRNAFWDGDTERTLNGASVWAIDVVKDGAWVQGEVDVGEAVAAKVTATAADKCVTFAPASPPTSFPSLAGKRIDVVVDRSLEMQHHQAALAQALTALHDAKATLRFVLGTSKIRGEDAVVVEGAIDVRSLVFYGSARPKELLRDWQRLHPTNAGNADAVLVFTAGSSFDVADDSKLDGTFPRTVLVHLGGKMPKGYDDATLDTIRRSGGTATADVAQAFARIADQSFMDGYAVTVAPCTSSLSSTTMGITSNAMAARQRILDADRGGLAPVDQLDALHKLAVEASVVTPYSSMLVLINDRQRQRLRDLSKQDDRFDREVEQQKKGASYGLLLSGCAMEAPPAPAEWESKVAAPEAPPPPPPSVTSTFAAPAELGDERVEGKDQRDNAKGLRPRANGGLALGNKLAQAVPQREDSAEPAMKAKEGLTVDDLSKNEADADANALAPSADPSAVPPPPTNDMPQNVQGVPEPEEWLLIILACCAIVAFELRRRKLA